MCLIGSCGVIIPQSISTNTPNRSCVVTLSCGQGWFPWDLLSPSPSPSPPKRNCQIRPTRTEQRCLEYYTVWVQYNTGTKTSHHGTCVRSFVSARHMVHLKQNILYTAVCNRFNFITRLYSIDELTIFGKISFSLMAQWNNILLPKNKIVFTVITSKWNVTLWNTSKTYFKQSFHSILQWGIVLLLEGHFTKGGEATLPFTFRKGAEGTAQ